MTQTFEQLIQAMSHYDKDNRFMAASDLTVYMMTSSSVDSTQQTRICNALLKQLEDTSLEVQGNSIKCLGRLMAVFNAQEAAAIIAKVITSMVEGAEELRDVFATGFKTFLPAISDSLAENVIAAILPRIEAVLKTRGKFPEATREHVLDVASESVRRFGISDSRKAQAEAIADLLAANVATETSPALRRRLIALLGALAAALDVEIFAHLWDERSKLDRLTLTKCVAAVSRGAGERMRSQADGMLRLLLENLEIPGDETESEIVEVTLHALEVIGPLCTHLIDLVARISDLLNFDPCAMESGNCEEEDFEFDEDDFSWKLRRGAAAVAVALARTRASDVRASLAPTFRNRLHAEREEVVVVELLAALEALEVGNFCEDFQLSVEAVLARRGGLKALKAALRFLAQTCKASEAARTVVAEKCGNFLASQLSASLAPEILDVLEAAASGFSETGAAWMVARLEEAGVFRSPQNRVHSVALRVAATLDMQGVSLAPAMETLRDAKADAESKEAAISVFVKFANPEISLEALTGLLRADATRLPALKALEILATRNFQVDVAAVAETLELQGAKCAALRVLNAADVRRNFRVFEEPLLRVLQTAEGETATEAVRLARKFWASDARFQSAALEQLVSPLTQPSTVEELSEFFRDFRSKELFAAGAGVAEQVEQNVARVIGRMSEISPENFPITSRLHLRVLGELSRRGRLASPEKTLEIFRNFLATEPKAAVAAWGGLARGYPELAISGFSAVMASAATAQTKAALLEELARAVAEGAVVGTQEISDCMAAMASDADEGCRDAAAAALAAAAVQDVEMDGGLGERAMGKAFDCGDFFGLAAVRAAAQSAASVNRKFSVVHAVLPRVTACMRDGNFRIRQKAYAAVAALLAAEVAVACGFEEIFRDVAVNEELIKVVDLGPFKHKVDEGEGLRRAAALLCVSLARNSDQKTRLAEKVKAQKDLADIHVPQ